MNSERLNNEITQLKNAASLYMNLMKMTVVFSTKDERSRKNMMDKLYDISDSKDMSKKDKYLKDICAIMGKEKEPFDYTIDEVKRYIDGNDIVPSDDPKANYPAAYTRGTTRRDILNAFTLSKPNIQIYYQEYKNVVYRLIEAKKEKAKEETFTMADPINRPSNPHLGPMHRPEAPSSYHNHEEHTHGMVERDHGLNAVDKALLEKKTLTPQEMETLIQNHPELAGKDNNYRYGRDTIEYGRIIYNCKKKDDISLEEMMRFGIAVNEALPMFLLKAGPGANNDLIETLGIPRSFESYSNQYNRFMKKFNKMSKEEQQTIVNKLESSQVKKTHTRMFGKNLPFPGLVTPVELRRSINEKIKHELIDNNCYGPLDTYRINLRLATRYMSVEEINKVYQAILDKHRKYAQMEMEAHREDDHDHEHEENEVVENNVTQEVSSEEYEEALQRDFVEVMYSRTKTAKKIQDTQVKTEEQKVSNAKIASQTQVNIITQVMGTDVLMQELQGVEASQEVAEEMFLQEKAEETYDNVSRWNSLLTKIRGKGRTR